MSFQNLIDWQRAIYPKIKAIDFGNPSTRLSDRVTALTYFFWNDKRIDTEFWRIEFSFLCTFRCCGLLPSVIVTNRKTSLMESFTEKFPNVTVLTEKLLGEVSNGVKALCIESISRMHTRFQTEYVLTIQNDGMPIHPGLERFVGKYDYIGAPWPRFVGYTDFYPYPRFGVGNGGFSLRSRRICTAAAEAYGKIANRMPFVQYFLGDDVFYCRTMPLFSRAWRKAFVYAPIADAARFSIECVTPYTPISPPLGFHRNGFDNYVKRFGVPMDDLLPDTSTPRAPTI